MVSSPSFAWRACPILALIAGMAAPSSAGFTIRDLGVLVPSGTSGAEAINATGQAAGVASTAGGVDVAAKTSGSGNLQAIGLPPNAVSSLASSINATGQIAGTYTDSQGVQHGFSTGMGGLGVISPLTGGTFTQANGINSFGQVVGTGDSAGGYSRAFVAGSGGNPTAIAPLGTGTFNMGSGINDNGTVVGTSETSPGGREHAFIASSPANPIDLLSRNSTGNFAFDTFGTAIANNGDVAGYGDVGQSEHAFFARNTGGALVDLGVLAGASTSIADGLNDLSQVVGQLGYGTGMPGTGDSRAFLWDAARGMFDLNSLISSSDQSQWVLIQATGINDSDQISGVGSLDGVLHGFILTPIAGESIFDPVVSVPEPPALVLSMMGLAIAAAWVRVRRGRTGGRAAA
jgi:probable HAF family extracellular repeat protein